VKALDRVERDIARGDLGSARRRLASFIGSAPYDPETLARVGDLCALMQDPLQAGRFWFLSSREGAEVESAIESFAASLDDGRLVWELPRFRGREGTVFPQVVVERLRRHGVDLRTAAIGPARRREERSRGGGIVVLVVGLALFVAVVAAGVAIVLGGPEGTEVKVSPPV
jgi:hypothetical protein